MDGDETAMFREGLIIGKEGYTEIFGLDSLIEFIWIELINSIRKFVWE